MDIIVLTCFVLFFTDTMNAAGTAMVDPSTGEIACSNTSNSAPSAITDCNTLYAQTDIPIPSCSQQIDYSVKTGKPSDSTGTVYIHVLHLGYQLSSFN